MDSSSVPGLAVTDRDGGGALVLLVHGSMDRASSFARVLRHLDDLHVVAYDRRGYGRSRDVAPSTDLAVQVDDLIGVLDGRRAVGVGHSFGGTLLLAAAQRRPDLVDSLVIYEPPQPWLANWPTDPPPAAPEGCQDSAEEAAEAFMRRMIGDRIWERLPAATRAQRRAEGHALRADMLALAEGAAFDPGQVQVPVILGRGERGRTHQRDGAAALAAALPDAELVEVAGAEHGVHLSHPADLAELIRLALRRRRHAPSSP